MNGTNVEISANDRALEAQLRGQRSGPPDSNESTWDFVRRWLGKVVRSRVGPVASDCPR